METIQELTEAEQIEIEKRKLLLYLGDKNEEEIILIIRDFYRE
jgi:hypothetical protein